MYILGNEFVNGTIRTNQNIYLNCVHSKIGIALGSAESSIQTAGLKTTTPSALGVHLGMDSLTGSAGVSVVATNISQNIPISILLILGYKGKGKSFTTTQQTVCCYIPMLVKG